MNKRALLPLVLAGLLLSGCGVTRGSGQVITESREVSNFDSISLSSIGTLVITQGDQESLDIEAEDNVLPRITTEVKDGTLYLAMETGDWQPVIPTKNVKFDLTMREITGIHFSGAGSVTAASIETDQLQLSISGAGGCTIGYLKADELDISMSGIGNLNVAGQVTAQEVDLSGSGSYNAPKLESQWAEVRISGAGGATVWATDRLDVNISGVGNVQYYGDPTVAKNITGLGRVVSLGNP